MGAVDAHALTLMDMLRGKTRDSVQEQVEGQARPAPTQREIDLSDPEPLPKVSAPKYLTYRTDAMRQIKAQAFPAAQAADATRFLASARVSAPADVAAAVEAYYAKGGAPLWVEKGDVSERARAVLALFDKAADYGFDPADYRLPVPSMTTASVADASAIPAAQPVASTDGAATAQPADATQPAPVATPAAPAPVVAGDQHDRDLMQFELAMSAKVVLFAQDMVRGRIDPNRISEYHDLKRRDAKLDLVLPFIQTAPDTVAYLQGLEPKSPEYLALKAELTRLRAESGNAPQVARLPDNLVLKPGNSSADLANLVAAIERRASDTLKTTHAATLAAYRQTPEYGPDLVELVKGFQKEAGLKADGVVGPATVRAIAGHSTDDKIEKVVIAMEQTRWLPDTLGDRYVFINQPAFRVYYHDQGREQFSMRVVVGSPSHQTFFFHDEIKTVELNPYWGVPQSIIINEMLPKLRQDPSYLDRMGYQVEVGGKAVSSTAVNWFASTQSVSVRQPPSSDNALGELKILFPNAHAIYMHDTPQKSFFQRDMRALSHGCVRLAEPRKMAAAVLGITEQDLAGRIAQGKNMAVPVTAKIPVYVSYFTAWPNKDGKVEFFDDVYGRDSAVEKAFAATSKARGA
ncbi:L,D-transpeptidase family protein [Rhizobium straminoryzae]|uniref:L,D-transpeptidase family protein n=2 Tax=Rhizobium straminoryzae TaxID=1387186 RepID=A0A549T4S7_9HYPH|nr:L,D-transpeptidase family protein [Rhizobium straminoryzae]TRL36891.1 L,D-transpeptidase family protein [Rhizobium straminoryzae]